MKIKSYIMAGMAALLLSACDETFNDWVIPAQNTQDAIVSFGNGSIATVDVIDFATITDDSVKVCDITAPTSSDAEYAAKRTFKLVLDDRTFDISENGKIAAEDLKNYIIDKYGKAPYEREITSRIFATIGSDNTSTSFTSDNFIIKAKLTAPKISANYYVVGGTLDWAESAASKAQKFNHSDKDVYDDPVFTITIPAGEGDTWFAIGDDEALDAISNDNVWNKLLGTASGNGNNGESGQLKARSELSDDGSFKVDAGAKYIKIEINMMDGTYKVTPLNFNQYIGVIGNHNGWGADEPIASPSYDGIYQGYVYLDGGFKIRQNASWDDADTWGGNGTVGALVQPGDNLNAEAGVYQVDVNLQTSTYSLTKVTSITCVGNHNGWNVSDASQHMTYNVENKCWEITTTLTNGFKFAMNDDWTVSWGGADGNPANYDNLTQYSGKDLDAPNGDGEYLVQFYLTCEGKSKVVLTKK
ncbi:MAG: hypothetical protein J5663_08280 [Bacteroidaceae bacterium]|nr:hypothetical protein [Bacteroidaceae bacterium]